MAMGPDQHGSQMQKRRTANAYIDIDASRCEACGHCVEACKHDVLELARFKRVSQIHIARPKRCTGCLGCVAACREQAIQPAAGANE